MVEFTSLKWDTSARPLRKVSSPAVRAWAFVIAAAFNIRRDNGPEDPRRQHPGRDQHQISGQRPGLATPPEWRFPGWVLASCSRSSRTSLRQRWSPSARGDILGSGMDEPRGDHGELRDDVAVRGELWLSAGDEAPIISYY